MTLSMNLEYEGGQGLRKFNAMVALAAWADMIGPELREGIKHETPIGQGAGAGRLRDSIRFERETSRVGLTLFFTANTPYAKYVVDGTTPHEIRPKAARALHWSNGGQHFAKVVHHPGTKPNDFAERALTHLEPLIRETLVHALQKQLEA